MTFEYTYVRDTVRPAFAVDRFLLRLIDAVTGVVEFLLAIRLVLRLLGANDGSAFMAWLDSITGQLIAPFAGIFPTLDLGGFQLELSTIFAMLAYGVIGWILARAVLLLVGTTSAL